MYQINTRQFTQEGTFAAAEKELPRLKELGVDILWLMPINPIGEKNRKGSLGSPYSVKDYFAINPEFGTEEDFRSFIKAVHANGMKVIVDWVANHTAWDNQLAVDHPDWYTKNFEGDFMPTAWWDWDDIIDLDYSSEELREYMTKALKYWVQEFDIDGYRCDVAGFVPTDFWNNARKELDAIKPVFMLAEWETKDLHEYAFDMSYAWSWNDSLHKICTKGDGLLGLLIYYSWNQKHWPENSIRMMHTSNHDKNSWEGTEFELFGKGVKAAIAFSFVSEGMPLIYNGQEAGNEKRLEFFEKDPIQWKQHEHGDLFKRLIQIKKEFSCLDVAPWGARMQEVKPVGSDRVFAFVRENEKEKIFVLLNFSDSPQKVSFQHGPQNGTYTELVQSGDIQITEDSHLELEPWGYRIFGLKK
ncbi:MAG: Alpha-amylase [Actinomycetota bacterium]|jgi:glycosidase